jgi:hypothetical protein
MKETKTTTTTKKAKNNRSLTAREPKQKIN